MKIGILGASNVGTTLANRLAAAGHQVKVANLRGPGRLPPNAVAPAAMGSRTCSTVKLDGLG